MRDVNLAGTTVVETLEGRVLLSATTAAARAARASVPAGQVLHRFGQRDDFRDAATQADGGTLVLGSTDRNSVDETGPQYFVARFSRNGRLDRRFGNGGKVLANVPNFQEAFAIAVAPDGKIVVGGGWSDTAEQARQLIFQYALTRYNSDGSLDPTFGEGGTVHADLDPGLSDRLMDLAVLPDGSIVATGIERDVLSQGGGREGFAVARFAPDGRLDPAFARGGVLLSDFGAPGVLTSKVAALPDGKLVLAGATGVRAGEQFAFARLNPDGTFDTTFGDGGRVRVTPAADRIGYPTGLAILPDGGIVAAGSVTKPTPPPATNFDLIDDRLVALVRLTPAGLPDANFGGGDGVVIDDDEVGRQADVYDLAALPNGSVVVGGSLTTFVGVPTRTLLLERYSPAGVYEGSLAGQRRGSKLPPFRRSLTARHVEIARGGKVVIAGDDAQRPQFALARFSRRGAADRSFGGARAIPDDLRRALEGSGAVTLLQDGTLQVTGTGQGDTFQFDPFTGSQGESVLVGVNGRPQIFPLGSVHSIVVSGGAGDDVITVAKALAIPARIDGGEGDDVISGGAGDDVLAGGAGADEVIGHAGTNQLFGHDATNPDDAGDLLNDEPTYGT